MTYHLCSPSKIPGLFMEWYLFPGQSAKFLTSLSPRLSHSLGARGILISSLSPNGNIWPCQTKLELHPSGTSLLAGLFQMEPDHWIFCYFDSGDMGVQTPLKLVLYSG